MLRTIGNFEMKYEKYKSGGWNDTNPCEVVAL